MKNKNLFKNIMYVITLVWAFVFIPISYLLDKGGPFSCVILIIGLIICPAFMATAIDMTNQCDKEKTKS